MFTLVDHRLIYNWLLYHLILLKATYNFLEMKMLIERIIGVYIVKKGYTYAALKL